MGACWDMITSLYGYDWDAGATSVKSLVALFHRAGFATIAVTANTLPPADTQFHIKFYLILRQFFQTGNLLSRAFAGARTYARAESQTRI